MTFLATVNTFQVYGLQGGQDLNLQPAVLETAALPIEPPPFAVKSTVADAKRAHEMMADFNYQTQV
jgi:hypothetical protein